jgi:hypothetical protein
MMMSTRGVRRFVRYVVRTLVFFVVTANAAAQQAAPQLATQGRGSLPMTAEDNRFGPMNSRRLAQRAYEKGMSILTGSQAYQAALESAQFGHGYLTFSLIEGLQTAVADRLPADGQVTAMEWFEYGAARVPQLQSAAVTRAQQDGRTLRFNSSGTTSGGLQRPRIFNRRDDAQAPFVVSIP